MVFYTASFYALFVVSIEFTKDEFDRIIAEIFIGVKRESPLVIEEARTRINLESSQFIRVIDESTGILIAEFERMKKRD